MVTWTYVLLHVPGGPKIPGTLTTSSGGTITVYAGGAIVAPSGLPDTMVTDEGMLSPNMGEAWCARAPYPPKVVADLAPEKKDGPWVLAPPVYDPVTIAAATAKGLTICARPPSWAIEKYYSELYSGAWQAPCAAPAEVVGASGSVPLIPTFPLRDNPGGVNQNIVTHIQNAVQKAEAAGYEPVFVFLAQIFTEDDLTTAADVIGELSDTYGLPKGLANCERVVRTSDRIQLDAISSLQWEAFRLHDAFYDWATDETSDAKRHAFACSLRAIASLEIACCVENVPRSEQYSLVYDADVPVPTMFYDEQALAMLLRTKAFLGETSPDPYHNLVRDFEAAVRTAVSPFPR